MRTVVLVTLEETCRGCPSQWEGLTSEEATFYARYRWGHWRVDIDGETVAEGDEGGRPPRDLLLRGHHGVGAGGEPDPHRREPPSGRRVVVTLPSDDETVLAANERIPRFGIFHGIVQSWRCRCRDTAGGHLGDASPPGWKQVRCGFAGAVWLCPTCLEERSQSARRGAATRARRKRGDLWKAPGAR